MADPNNLVLHDYKLAIMFICKAGNSSLKRAIADALQLPEYDAPERLQPHRRIDLYCPTPNIGDVKGFKENGYLTLSVIRHPLARLASCWIDKLQDHFHVPFKKKYGLERKMSFEDWVSFVHDIPDGKADQHFRSMKWDLVLGNTIVPEHIIKVEDQDWWERVRDLIKDHCSLDIGIERFINKSSLDDWQSLYDEKTKLLACERYVDDLRIFGYAV